MSRSIATHAGCERFLCVALLCKLTAVTSDASGSEREAASRRPLLFPAAWNRSVAMDDQPDVGAHPHRPEVRILRLAQPMELHPRVSRIHLQIEGSRLHRLLLVAGERRQAVGEGVGDEEVHGVYTESSGFTKRI